MNYYELIFTLISHEDYQQDLLINQLSEIGFDTFEVIDFGFKAYIPTEKFDAETLSEQIQPYQELFTFSYEVNLIPYKNWNEVWESNFEPILIKDKVYVRATFHEPKTFPIEIVIDPKMSFGTGHHQTTALMMEFMLEMDLAEKDVLDMGCGTGILAVLASKLKAKNITAIDNDLVCYESVLENTFLNNVLNVDARHGAKEAIPQLKYDIILANINRNILIDQLKHYTIALKPDGELLMSGFYESPDLEIIIDAARSFNLKYINHKTLNNWVAARFVL